MCILLPRNPTGLPGATVRYGNKGNQATCSSLRMPALVFICLPNPIWGPKFWTRGTRPWLFIVPKHIYPSFGEWKDDLHIVSGCSRDCIRSGCSQLQLDIFPTARLQCMLLYNSCIKAPSQGMPFVFFLLPCCMFCLQVTNTHWGKAKQMRPM